MGRIKKNTCPVYVIIYVLQDLRNFKSFKFLFLHKK